MKNYLTMDCKVGFEPQDDKITACIFIGDTEDIFYGDAGKSAECIFVTESSLEELILEAKENGYPMNEIKKSLENSIKFIESLA